MNCTIIALLIFGCSKKMDPPPGNRPPGPPPPVGVLKDYKLKIIEQETNLPIEGAKVTFYECLESGKYGCTKYNILGTWTSDAKGNIFVAGKDYSSKVSQVTIDRNDYWSRGRVPYANTLHSEADTFFQKTTFDSLVYKLYPEAFLNLHVKNEKQYGPKEMIRVVVDIMVDDYSLTSQPLTYDLPATGTDTTFLYKTYGNANNRVQVILIDSMYNFKGPVFEETNHVGKNATFNWNVFY